MTSKKTQQTQPLFNLGDTFEFDGEQVKVVELLESGNVHLKKIDPPYSSFIVTEGEAKDGKRKCAAGGVIEADTMRLVGEGGGPEIQAPITVGTKVSKED